MKKQLINILNKLPYIRGLYQDQLQYKKNACFPPGHYYSSVIDMEEIKGRQDEIWAGEKLDGIEGIKLNSDRQVKLVGELQQFYTDVPFKAEKVDGLRYNYDNGFYSYTDAIVLHSMMRLYQPKKIIEVGSGLSSAVMLDTNEKFFNNEINLTFIEPYIGRLKSILKESDHNSTKIVESVVQSVPTDIYETLDAGDILFIDSTHVAKTGSDLVHLIFNVLPKLKKGVLIHFHDVFYPFEYPKEWVFEGRNWNEDYMLRAFLMYNDNYEIKLFADYLHKHHETVFKEMPLCYNNSGGNLWLEKK